MGVIRKIIWGNFRLMDRVDIAYQIEKSKENAVSKENVDLSKISSSFGIFIIFADSIDNVVFKESEGTDNGVDAFLLNEYISGESSDILYFKIVKNLKSEMRKFIKETNKNASKPEIIFNQISDVSKLSFGLAEITEEQYRHGGIMECFLELYNKYPVMNKQFKSNDAAPSWNGFNFQGFVTILRTLECINSLPESEYANYSVEIEKYEDFIIYKNDIPQEVFQVKAYVTEKKISAYSEACEKLITHREQVGAPNADCYLATAAPISEWDKSAFSKVIDLYGYKSGRFIKTIDIITHIKKEIAIFFAGIEGEQAQLEVDIAFACISRIVIDKIDHLHHHRHASKREYRITFLEIADLLKKSAIETYDHQIFFTKLKIDEKVLFNLDTELLAWCSDCEKDSCSLCPLNDLRESFESINRETYAKILDPTVIIGESGVGIAEVFSGPRILEMFEILEIIDLDILFCDNQHIYVLNRRGISEYLDKIIPSSIKIRRGNGLTRVLGGIQKDTQIQNIYANSAVTAEMSDEIVEYKKQKIYVIPESSLGRSLENEKLSISPDFNFNLINRNTFLKRSLEDE